MRKRAFLLGTVLAVSAIALFVVWPTAGIAGGGADSADHALIDQTGGDTSVSCHAVNGSPFLVLRPSRVVLLPSASAPSWSSACRDGPTGKSSSASSHRPRNDRSA